MPGNLDDSSEQGNSFFVGHHEQTAIPSSSAPSKGVSRVNPLDKMKWTVMHVCPEITPGQMDRVWFEARLSGLLERYNEPGFEEELEDLVKQVTSVARVVEAYIKHIDRR